MKISLSRNEIMKILCEKYGIEYGYDGLAGRGGTRYDDDEIYWQGNLEDKK